MIARRGAWNNQHRPHLRYWSRPERRKDSTYAGTGAAADTARRRSQYLPGMDPHQYFEPRHIRTGAFIRLTQSIPELALNEGDIGVVRGVIPGPADAYDVEFHRINQDVPARALLLAWQIEPQEGPLLTDARVAAFHW